MKIILNKNKLTKILEKEKNIGFVPTMGAIHAGHLSLIRKSNSQCDKTIVSIFVNKSQFNKRKDYEKYPRPISKDISILRSHDVDFLYLPRANQIYPHGHNKKIEINSFEKKLCGRFRPGHFRAVTDVIDRFNNIIRPKRIYFGEKDMQQLKIIEDYFKKKKLKRKIIGCKTIREKNGVALSSRNLLLKINEKKLASKIYKLIIKNKQKIIKNKKILIDLKKQILSLGVKKIDYLEICDINKLIKTPKIKKKHKIFIAYYLDKVRLIDNI